VAAFLTVFSGSGQKSGPIAGATFQRGKSGRVSGKAKEVAVSPGEAALREMVTGKDSEGHFFGLRPL
jgi:hypothetical protein